MGARARQHPRHELARGSADHEAAGAAEQRRMSPMLQLAPRRECPLEQGHVGGMLVIRLANDARLAVMGTVAVRRVLGVEAEDAQAASSERVRGRAAHRAEADDDYIECIRHYRKMRFSRHGPRRMTPSAWCITRNPPKPLGAGQDWVARYCSAAASLFSCGSPSAREKSSATEHPGIRTPAAPAVLFGEKPSG